MKNAKQQCKVKKSFRIFIIIFSFLLLLFSLAPIAQAVSWWPLVPCGLNAQPKDSSGVELPKVPTQENPDAHDYTQPCNQCDLFRLFKNIIDFVLIGLMPPAAAILFIWGGFLILMGGANPGWITQGRTIFWNTAIGVAIILASWLITNTIIRSIAADNIAPEWWKFQCRVTTVSQLPPEQQPPVPQPPGPQPTPGPGQPPAGSVLSIATSSLNQGVQDLEYYYSLVALGGTAPYTWSVFSGALPAGLVISNSGIPGITGKPVSTGVSTFTIKVTDSSSPVQSATKQFSLMVVAQAASVIISNVASSNITANSARITWTTDKPATSQVAYGPTTAYGLSTTLNTSPVTNHSVNITGLTPGTTYNFQAVSTITGFTARSSNYTFKTTGTSVQPISITTASLAGATQNTAYSQPLSATGGTTPYNWTVSSGTLPVGLNLNISSGIVFGTPTTTGTSTFTVRVTDNSTPRQSATKQLSIKVATKGTLTCGQPWEQNLCQARSMTCSASACSQYVGAINQYAGGAASASFLKAVMIKESTCNISADSGHAYGLMQLVPSTANIYKSRCGVTENITSTWLKTSANASASICIAAEYIRALSSTSCGNTPRNIAAGYNGGSGACGNSVSCAGETSCDGSPVKKWECLYDDIAHTICNEARPNNYKETRDYATKVLYCYNNPGF